MTTFEAIIKVAVDDPATKRAHEIVDGLAYAAALLIDEYGYMLVNVEAALDEARQQAEDRWYDLHPTESDRDDSD